MTQSAYRYMSETWKKHEQGYGTAQWNRLVEWRAGDSFVRVERPLRVDRARVRRGGLRKKRFVQGRVPSKMGVNKITMRQNTQAIAEVRASKHFPNLNVLNSYWIGEDGHDHYYEVILVDAHHPSIQADKDLGWMAQPSATRRVLRGMTSAGKKHRGLRYKGTGSEHTRPSVNKSHVRRKDRLLWKKQDQAVKTRL